MRGEERSGDCLKKVKGLKNMGEGPLEMDNGVGNVCGNGAEGGLQAGWRGAKREHWDNRNGINNKKKNKTFN